MDGGGGTGRGSPRRRHRRSARPAGGIDRPTTKVRCRRWWERSETRRRPGGHLADVEGLGTFAADDDGVHVVAAGPVVEKHRGASGAGEPAPAPCVHRRQHRIGVAPLAGQPVLVAGRVRLVLDSLEDPLVDQAVEADRKHVATDPERPLEVVVAADAEASLADQEDVPVVAEDVRAAGDVAWPGGGVGASHAFTSASASTSRTRSRRCARSSSWRWGSSAANCARNAVTPASW